MSEKEDFGMAGQRRKANPDHKASFSYGVHANCSCGWSSSTWFGKGSKGSAASEWHSHREKCEALGATCL